MAELALAIIPLGITVTSGLVKYLKAFNDHDDDRARLVCQAERFASTFQSLEAILKHSQLIPELSVSASEASVCLRECQTTLEELGTLQQKIFVSTTTAVVATSHTRTKDKIKDGWKKLMYPLRQSDIEALQNALNKLSTALNLALGMLRLDEQYLGRKALNDQVFEIKKSTIINSNTSTAVKELRQPIIRMDLALPGLQNSVDSIIPQLDQRLDQISHQQLQMQAQIKSFFEMASTTRYQDHLGTNPQFLYSHSGQQDKSLSTHGTDSELLTLSRNAGSLPMCSCQLRRVRQSKRVALGPVHFDKEILSDPCHEKGCAFFIPSSGYEKTRKVRFTGLASLLKKGIEVSFSTYARDGRFNISPSFAYFPIVDHNAAPAFLLMSILEHELWLKELDEKQCKVILSTAQQKLQELFCSGRASPNDVTQRGETLLHRLSFLVLLESTTLHGANSPFVRWTCEGLLNFLVTAGTSVTARNSSGDLALHRVIDGTFVPASIYKQLSAGNDVDDRSNMDSPLLMQRHELIDYYNLNQSVASIQYGPLSLAVIRNNLLEVERLISIHPNMIQEVSRYGETPLHMAIYRPEILKALAKKANPELWVWRDNDGVTVLYLAIQLSSETCNSEGDLDDLRCPCMLPLRIILATGCPIIPYRDFNQHVRLGHPEWFFSEAPLHCKTLVVKELQSRRRQLRDLARKKLSITEFSKFTILEEVPDIDAIEMDRLLRQRGILGLGPLSTFVDEDLPQQPCRDVGYYSRSIFFDLAKPEDADLFVDSDFKVIRADEDHDSSLVSALFNSRYPWMRFISLDYAIWLFEHQAPLWKWSSRFTSPMPSIFVLADIHGMQDCKCPGEDNLSDKAEHYLFESVLVDNCSCLCSFNGCTPFASRMKWLAHPHNNVEDFAFHDYATRFGAYAEMHGRSLNMGHHVIMVRQATFAALDLNHTCLDRPGNSRWWGAPGRMHSLEPVTEMDPDDKEFEILNVDAEAVNQLKEMIVTFQDFVLTGHQTTALSKSESYNNDYSLFNEPSAAGIDDLCYQRVLEFWKHIWVSRMQVALKTVAEKWENKLDGQNDLVQILTCEEDMSESSEEEDDEVISNRIIQQIQDI